jgi:hypothetical protein
VTVRKRIHYLPPHQVLVERKLSGTEITVSIEYFRKTGHPTSAKSKPAPRLHNQLCELADAASPQAATNDRRRGI